MQKIASECYATEIDIQQFMGENVRIFDPTKFYDAAHEFKLFIIFYN